ncbi:hypothetical protein D6774_04855 [Candidatus Woesearchaeota archaeon]|nr:MAG: hypothetical protein D6774_04855 [Candidatus Woesearchaeota archaeon]
MNLPERIDKEVLSMFDVFREVVGEQLLDFKDFTPFTYSEEEPRRYTGSCSVRVLVRGLDVGEMKIIAFQANEGTGKKGHFLHYGNPPHLYDLPNNEVQLPKGRHPKNCYNEFFFPFGTLDKDSERFVRGVVCLEEICLEPVENELYVAVHQVMDPLQFKRGMGSSEEIPLVISRTAWHKDNRTHPSATPYSVANKHAMLYNAKSIGDNYVQIAGFLPVSITVSQHRHALREFCKQTGDIKPPFKFKGVQMVI